MGVMFIIRNIISVSSNQSRFIVLYLVHFCRRINSTGNVYEEDMAEVKAIMEQVLKTQKVMLKTQPLIHNG